jgi:class 3 adenylate cyclase
MQTAEIDPHTSSQKVRKLAAVMFTDMTGFTALMQEG